MDLVVFQLRKKLKIWAYLGKIQAKGCVCGFFKFLYIWCFLDCLWMILQRRSVWEWLRSLCNLKTNSNQSKLIYWILEYEMGFNPNWTNFVWTLVFQGWGFD